MTEIVQEAAPAKGRPAWALAGRWALWIGGAYAAGLVAARAAVTYRYGGEILSPYFATVLGSALVTALASWPLLAFAARDRATAMWIRSSLQWIAIAGLTGFLLLGLGAMCDETSLQAVSRVIAKDVPSAADNTLTVRK